MSNQINILDIAKGVVLGERQKAYGSPKKNFEKVAKYWSNYLNVEIRPKDVAMMMILLKVSREENKHTQDNLIDIAGYSLISEMLEKGDKN